MYRFVGLVFSPSDPSAASLAGRFVRAICRDSSCLFPHLSVPGLIVIADRPTDGCLKAYVLPGDTGIVLGRLFAQARAARSHGDITFSPRCVHELAHSGGARLFERYWGQYVAFVRESRSSKTSVMRDPSGMLPCYYTVKDGVYVFFSNIADLELLELPPLSVNERYIAASIYATILQIRETAFNEVKELLAGDRVEVSDHGASHTSLWDPRRIALEHRVDDAGTAAEAIRETTQLCIDAWAQCHKRVLLSLSGGLDSAIVLGSLASLRDRPDVICFNQYRAETLGDERPYARAAASRAGVQLVERPWAGSRYTSRLFDFPPSAKPTATDLHFMLEMDFRNALAKEFAADAIWTGQGGDHLFWAVRSLPVVADYLHERRIDSRLVTLVAESARLSEKSYWSTLAMAARLATARTATLPDRIRTPSRHFVSPDALGPDIAEYIAHPWASRPTSLAPVKHTQMALLADVLNRHRHLAGAEHAYERHPLLSQPLVELCMRIPTYVLVGGGRSRALARKAFEHILPAEILNRAGKGDYSQQARELIRESETLLRDLLLNGFLVRHRLVSRNELERHLVHGQSLKEDQVWPLGSCIAIEVWAEACRRHGHLRWAA